MTDSPARVRATHCSSRQILVHALEKAVRELQVVTDIRDGPTYKERSGERKYHSSLCCLGESRTNARVQTKRSSLTICSFIWMLVYACVRPWLIPSADICEGNAYFFANFTKCTRAPGRKAYCVGRDAGFCPLRATGNHTGLYQVECG